MQTLKFWCLAFTWGWTMLTMLSITSRRETWSIFKVILPLSILDMSSTSLISPSRCWLEREIFFRQCCTCWRFSILAVAIAVMPTMAFMGVRMSWLMLDKNSLFALLACSAARWAFSASRRASTAMVRDFSAVFLALSSSTICCRVSRK